MVGNRQFFKTICRPAINSIKHLLPSFKNVGLYEHHSLVMITNSKASYEEVLDFKNIISKTIFNNYSIHLDVEPTIII